MGQAEIVQSAGGFHDIIDVMVNPITKRLHQNLKPFDPTNVVFHFDAKAGNILIVDLLNRRERPIAGFLLRLLNAHPLWGKPLKPRILPYRTAIGKLQVFLIRNRLVMFLAFVGITQVANFALTVRYVLRSVLSLGRLIRPSVPSMMNSKLGHRLRTLSRLAGSRSGSCCSYPND